MEQIIPGSKHRTMYFLHIAFEFKILRESGRESASFVTVFATFSCSWVVAVSPQ